MKYIKNNTLSDKTWVGQVVEPNAYFLIPEDKKIAFANSDTVLTDIANSEAIMAKDDTGNNDITSVTLAINFLKNLLNQDVSTTNYAFAAKKLPDGKNLFTRVHGVSASVQNASDDIDFVIPYPNCKITGIEIVGCDIGDKINMKVLDTPTGTISGIADYELNQFGFDVWMPNEFYRYKSEYDADLIENMKIRIEYDAKDDLLPKTVYINFILHQVV